MAPEKKDVRLEIGSRHGGTGLVLTATGPNSQKVVSEIHQFGCSEVIKATTDRQGNEDLRVLKTVGRALEGLRRDLGLGDQHVYWYFHSEGAHVPLEGARSSRSTALVFDSENTFIRAAPSCPGKFGVDTTFKGKPRVLVLWPEADQVTFTTNGLELLRKAIVDADADVTVVHDWDAMCAELVDIEKRPHVLHIACHGEPGKIADPATNEEITTSRVSDTLKKDNAVVPSVVVCTVCHGSDPEPSTNDDELGQPALADALLGAGVDAVVSWTGEAHMDEAVVFAASFWSAVLMGAPLDRAALAGRCAQREIDYRQQWAMVSLSTTLPDQPIFPHRYFNTWLVQRKLAEELDDQVSKMRLAIRAVDSYDEHGSTDHRAGSSGPVGLGLFIKMRRLIGVDARGEIHDLTDIRSDELLAGRGGDSGVDRTGSLSVETSAGGEAAAAMIGDRIVLWTDLDGDRPRVHDGPSLEPGSRLLAIHRRSDDGYSAVVARPSDASGPEEGLGTTVLVRWSIDRPDDQRCLLLTQWPAVSACVDGTTYLLADPDGQLVAVDWRGELLALPEGLTTRIALLHATAQRGMLGRRFRLVTENEPGGWSVYGPDGLVTRVAEDPRPLGVWLVPDVDFGRSPVIVIARHGGSVELRPVGAHGGP